MPKLNPQQIADKQIRRLQQASQDIITGIDSVSEAPAQAAIAQQQLMLQKLIDSVNDGTWAAELGKVTLNDWKTAMKEKGVPRVGPGIAAARQKLVDFQTWLGPVVDGAKAEVDAMPKGTISDSIARSTAFMTRMHENKFKGR